MSDTKIKVEVAYALPDKQKLIAIEVDPGTTAYEATVQSNINQFFPELDLQATPMGLFGQALGVKGLAPAKEYVLKEGDRVELYRPLTIDPKEARRKRAIKAKSKD